MIVAAETECEDVEGLEFNSESESSLVGVLLAEGDGCGLNVGHSRLSPETEAICRGCSQASMRLRLCLLGLGSVDSRASGRGGRALSWGNGLSRAGSPILLALNGQLRHHSYTTRRGCMGVHTFWTVSIAVGSRPYVGV